MTIKYKTMKNKEQKTLGEIKKDKIDFIVCDKHLLICIRLCPYCKEENAQKKKKSIH